MRTSSSLWGGWTRATRSWTGACQQELQELAASLRRLDDQLEAARSEVYLTSSSLLAWSRQVPRKVWGWDAVALSVAPCLPLCASCICRCAPTALQWPPDWTGAASSGWQGCRGFGE